MNLDSGILSIEIIITMTAKIFHVWQNSTQKQFTTISDWEYYIILQN
jgi:hypothetical protein